jgi:mono/diheme cytochrome c family protein
MLRVNLLVAGSLFLFAITLGAVSSSGQSDEHPSLPQGAGRDVMIRVCSQCHAPEMAADQQLDAAGWKSVVDQMAAKGAMATDAELDQIVSYLAAAFPPSK